MRPAWLASAEVPLGLDALSGVPDASRWARWIFHRTPLRLWFEAAWQMTSQKHGVCALGVQRSLGLGSYQTA